MGKLGKLEVSKESGKKKSNKLFGLVVGVLIAILVLVVVVNLNSFLGYPKEIVIIKYFYSPSCPWCEKTEAVMEKVLPEFGNKVVLEKKCVKIHDGDEYVCIGEYGLEEYNEFLKEAKDSGIKGTPTLYFNDKKLGFMEEDRFREEVCYALYGPLYFGEKITPCT
ncbi:MAG: DsbA family protein [archaeon]|nr:thioredoxin fold domain-containing protein [Candidatus Micrarchaeota archaeon]